MESKIEEAQKVLTQNEKQLMIPGVEGVGIGGTSSAPVILVMVRSAEDEIAAKLPRQVGGYPVKVEVTGEIKAY